MWKRLSALWFLLRSDLRLAWRALGNAQTPKWFKWGLAGLAAYFFMPIDLLPDFIPILGQVDDYFVLSSGLRFLLKRLPKGILEDVTDATKSAMDNLSIRR